MDSQHDFSEPLIASKPTNKPLHTSLVGTEHDTLLGGCSMGIAFGDDNNDDADFDDEDFFGCACGIVQNDDDDEASFSLCDNLVVWIFLPALVMFQFGMAFVSNHALELNSMIVNYSIFSFVLTAALYRRSCRANNIKNCLVLLLPEIILNVILGLLLFNKVVEGYMLLLAGMLFLAVFGIVNTVRLFLCAPKDELEDSFHDGRLRSVDNV